MELWPDGGRSRQRLLFAVGVVAVPLTLLCLAWALVATGAVDLTGSDAMPEYEFDATCVEGAANGDTVRVEYVEGDEPVQNHSSDVVWARADDARGQHAFASPVEPGTTVTLRDVNRTTRLEVGWDSGTSENALILDAFDTPCESEEAVGVFARPSR
jgi:hypothetical protein